MRKSEISGAKAIKILERMSDVLTLHRKDKTNKFWSYKLLRGSRVEIAFDPRTTTILRLRCDRLPPAVDGIRDVRKIEGCDVSTALARVFTGGQHVARFEFTVATESALIRLLERLEAVS
ncbi:hypothetical protein [Aquipseudomonas alcaligenes]|uniref:hypothetical protein n=1 Tax=Aquipseudomonas alcaligenes TaxID=43263 RepID=UPI001F3EB42E|nr:hypothetical protein [Pseudomonas alcaligenes]